MIKSLLIILCIVNINLSQNINSNFEFSGYDEFLNITSKLERNVEPSSYEWNKLFNTPGYKVLTSGEFSKQFFIENFELVFMPSKRLLSEGLLPFNNSKYSVSLPREPVLPKPCDLCILLLNEAISPLESPSVGK